MQKHTKIYMTYFDYGIEDFIPCEVCGSKAVDIHHLEAKGMGGSKTKDYIENLAALCREHHVKCHANKEYNNEVKQLHQTKI